jgi:choline dehydrogenase-like flavoprotein
VVSSSTSPRIEAEWVFVGGGSAGCVLAARLSEDPAQHVVLLEAGPDWRASEAPPQLRSLNGWRALDESACAPFQWRGLEGLWVADASVFPEVPRANTNLPTIAAAERLSDLIRAAPAASVQRAVERVAG